MPSTQHEATREQKREEIVRVASELFMHEGYDATSIQRLAREVQVAPNTLYWYFADKDALLVAVLDRLLSRGLQGFERRKRSSFEAQVRWLLDMLWGMRKLIATVHVRVGLSAAVREWHEGFHRLIEVTVEGQLRARGLVRGHEAHAAKTAMYVVEGALAHEMPPAEQRRLMRWLMSVLR